MAGAHVRCRRRAFRRTPRAGGPPAAGPGRLAMCAGRADRVLREAAARKAEWVASSRPDSCLWPHRRGGRPNRRERRELRHGGGRCRELGGGSVPRPDPRHHSGIRRPVRCHGIHGRRGVPEPRRCILRCRRQRVPGAGGIRRDLYRHRGACATAVPAAVVDTHHDPGVRHSLRALYALRALRAIAHQQSGRPDVRRDGSRRSPDGRNGADCTCRRPAVDAHSRRHDRSRRDGGIGRNGRLARDRRRGPCCGCDRRRGGRDGTRHRG